VKHLHHPDRSDIQLSAVLYALSDPIRLHIVVRLLKDGEQSCSGIEVPVAKSTLSHHARTLREAGIIHTRAQGTQRFLSVRTEDLEARFPGLLETIVRAYENSGEKLPVLPEA
jgi:DNA-binding transcriptional ArsR family regulator